VSESITELNLIQLKQAVRVAALPAEQQISSFPPGVDIPFEVADDFYNWCRWALNSTDVALTDAQRSCLNALQKRIDQMSGKSNAALWTEDALHCHPEWNAVRLEAGKILDLFQWSIEKPGSVTE
jgi:hypothetical protein